LCAWTIFYRAFSIVASKALDLEVVRLGGHLVVVKILALLATRTGIPKVHEKKIVERIVVIALGTSGITPCLPPLHSVLEPRQCPCP
jgi:hypothetical protein